jgi:two-component system, NarL family, nitrate/nitrite response regulator NarL
LASIRVLIVDDSQPWRRAVCLFLQQQLNLVVVCESADGLEAVQKSEEFQPDLVLLDISLPTLNGLEAARQIRKVAPGSKILFLSSYDYPELLREALRIGALGFVVKWDVASDLVPAVTAVMQDEQFFSNRLSPRDSTKPSEA